MATIFSKIAAGEIPSYKIAADDESRDLTMFAKRVAEALEAVMPCKRIGVAVIGLEVPHAHIHLIPLNTEKDMDFSHKMTLPEEEMKRIADAVSAEFNRRNK